MRNVAFITGASSGIGAALARRYGEMGWAVGLAARREDRLEAVAREIRAAGGEAVVCPCDVAEREQVHAAIARAERELGSIDLLIANAGISELTPAQDLDALLVERVMLVNFMGAVYAAEAVLPGMIGRGQGRIVAVGSLTGYGGLPRTGAYSASKGAMHNFFESLRLDLRGSGVSVTMITPGYVRTELAERNLHRMPFMVDLDDAVDRMVRAIDGRRGLLNFPRPLSSLLWVAQVFPTGLYDWLASKVRRRKRQPGAGGDAPPADKASAG